MTQTLRFSKLQDPNSFEVSEGELEGAIQQVRAFVDNRGKRLALNPTKFMTRGELMLQAMDLFHPNPYGRAMTMWNLGWRGPWNRGATRST